MQLSSKNTVLADPGMESMAALYRQYAPAILSYLSRNVSSEEDAEDMLVEVFAAKIETVAPSLILPACKS
jgi:DNA-directed RNA polymerase specialized sigma24 family protein